jgi:hypothetical protein
MSMNTKLDSTASALVSAEIEWIPVSDATPTGARCLVIDELQGIAYLRPYWPDQGWSHWHPLPRFSKEKK